LFSKLRNNFRESLYSRKLKKIILTTKICNILITRNYQKSITKFSLYNFDKISLNMQEKRICYNCNKKKYIQKKYFKFVKNNLQVNAINNS